ncbi:MAG: DUF882 domain-containing protein [Saccharospirillaceae bacterium]|nr:DUF882 domain-containing protein [Saccharospirillaceae bacterium]
MLSRRQLIISSSLLSIPSISLANLSSKQFSSNEIALNLFNIHTGERFNDLIIHNNQPISENLAKVHHLLRDFRQNEIEIMDINILMALNNIKNQTNHLSAKSKSQPIQIISGYRSPKTNAMLHNNSTGVAKKSYHMKGKAIDFRIEGIRTQTLFEVARSQKIGGTGKYISSGFIHLDTGRVRSWG